MVWNVTAHAEPVDPREQLRVEAAAFAAAGPLAVPRAWLWEPASPLLVVTRPETTLPEYARAQTRLVESGWPIYERATGGSAVPLAPGMLVMTQIDDVTGRACQGSLAMGFERLCAPLVAALESLGVKTTLGAVPGAFCDGRYNLVCRDRKLAGTAQRQRRREPGGLRVMGHAVLLVEAASRDRASVIYRFYEWAGAIRPLTPDAVTTVATEAPRGGQVSVAEVREAIARALRAASGPSGIAGGAQ